MTNRPLSFIANNIKILKRNKKYKYKNDEKI